MTTLIEQLLHSPQLSLYYQQIQAVLEEERTRRQRFYDTITEQEKAEFINGEVVVQSPARLEHTDASGNLLVLLRTYVQIHNLGFVGYEKMLITLTRNDYEPDICFFGTEKAVEFTPKQMQFPAPDLVVEVLSPSTEAKDRGLKFEDYAAHGVREYWLLDPALHTVEQYVLQDSAYQLLTKARSGTIASVVVVGFDIPIRAIFDKASNLQTLQQIVAQAPSG
ncbi:MAG: Uma2 family endonuclease [Chloroflexales bacterium]|nr:Uma2 family endonuclease [Chloroflexales bacterium]